MTINSTRTVRDLVTEMPGATRIFEKFKIDYCCGGNASLTEACTKAGVDVQAIENLLDSVASTKDVADVDFNELKLTSLIDHIVTKHHVYTKDEMIRLDALMAKVVSVHGANHPELQQASGLFRKLYAELTPHMFKEEQILFPYIVELERSASDDLRLPFAPFGTVNNPVRMMMMEHDAAGEILRELRKVTSDYAVPADVCISYKTLYEALEALESDLHQHIHLENNILFPKAIECERMIAG